MSNTPHADLTSEKATVSLPRRRRVLYGALASLFLIGAIALGLGLGLGLGLKHHRHDNTVSSPGGSSNSANLPALDTSSPDNFVLNGLVGQLPQTRSFDFEISQVEGAPDGVRKPMIVVNGIYPGPTLELNQGDRLVVNVTNKLENRTTIHWHGLFQNQTNFYDGTEGITECGIPPGQFLVYNFTMGEFSGTTWYQLYVTTSVTSSASDGVVSCVAPPLTDTDSTQYTDGVTGALIVHPSTAAPADFPTWDTELVVQLSDLYHTFSSILLAEYLSAFGIDGTPGDEPVPDGGTINGLGQWDAGGAYFNFTLEANTTYRLRLIHTGSFASMRFSVDDHPLTIIEVDGTLVQPYVVSGLTLAVAQRYSVLLRTNVTGGGAFWMRAGVQSDMFTYDEPGQNLDIRGIIRYGEEANNTVLPTATDDPGTGKPGLDDLDTALLVPAVVDRPPERTRQYPLTISLQNTNDGRFLAFMNSTSWAPLQGMTTLLEAHANGAKYGPEGGSLQPGEQFMITEDSIQVIDLQIDNLDDGDHPFHLHGHRPWIMGTGAGRYVGQELNSTNPLRRDTVLIPAYNWMILRFVTDNPGLWAFHCHLAWHMAAGLLMQINSLPSTLAMLDIPQVIVNQCQGVL